jgi:uncharacterized membrane protein
VGSAATPTPDPDGFFNGDFFVAHAFAWQMGIMTDLGSLPGNNNVSNATWINEPG